MRGTLAFPQCPTARRVLLIAVSFRQLLRGSLGDEEEGRDGSCLRRARAARPVQAAPLGGGLLCGSDPRPGEGAASRRCPSGLGTTASANPMFGVVRSMKGYDGPLSAGRGFP